MRDKPSIYSRTGHFGRPGSIAPAEEPAVVTYGEGRVCGHKGCGTILSTYNPLDYCGLHADEHWDPRTLDRPCTGDGCWVCPACGSEYPPGYRHWRADPRSKDGLSAVCIDCQCKKGKSTCT